MHWEDRLYMSYKGLFKSSRNLNFSKAFEGGHEEKTSREVTHERLGTPPWQRTTAYGSYIVQEGIFG
jgi:hypothetical protein